MRKKASVLVVVLLLFVAATVAQGASKTDEQPARAAIEEDRKTDVCAIDDDSGKTAAWSRVVSVGALASIHYYNLVEDVASRADDDYVDPSEWGKPLPKTRALSKNSAAEATTTTTTTTFPTSRPRTLTAQHASPKTKEQRIAELAAELSARYLNAYGCVGCATTSKLFSTAFGSLVGAMPSMVALIGGMTTSSKRTEPNIPTCLNAGPTVGDRKTNASKVRNERLKALAHLVQLIQDTLAAGRNNTIGQRVPGVLFVMGTTDFVGEFDIFNSSRNMPMWRDLLDRLSPVLFADEQAKNASSAASTVSSSSGSTRGELAKSFSCAMDSFLRFGSYTKRDTSQFLPVEYISLNTIPFLQSTFDDYYFSHKCSRSQDRADAMNRTVAMQELEWLKQQLDRIEAAHEHAIVVGEVPFGIHPDTKKPTWHPQATAGFRRLMDRYCSTILGHIFASHFGSELRLMKESTCNNLIVSVGGLAPLGGNNPIASLVDFNLCKVGVSNWTQISYDLSIMHRSGDAVARALCGRDQGTCSILTAAEDDDTKKYRDAHLQRSVVNTAIAFGTAVEAEELDLSSFYSAQLLFPNASPPRRHQGNSQPEGGREHPNAEGNSNPLVAAQRTQFVHQYYTHTQLIDADTADEAIHVLMRRTQAQAFQQYRTASFGGGEPQDWSFAQQRMELCSTLFSDEATFSECAAMCPNLLAMLVGNGTETPWFVSPREIAMSGMLWSVVRVVAALAFAIFFLLPSIFFQIRRARDLRRWSTQLAAILSDKSARKMALPLPSAKGTASSSPASELLASWDISLDMLHSYHAWFRRSAVYSWLKPKSGTQEYKDWRWAYNICEAYVAALESDLAATHYAQDDMVPQRKKALAADVAAIYGAVYKHIRSMESISLRGVEYDYWRFCVPRSVLFPLHDEEVTSAGSNMQRWIGRIQHIAKYRLDSKEKLWRGLEALIAEEALFWHSESIHNEARRLAERHYRGEENVCWLIKEKSPFSASKERKRSQPHSESDDDMKNFSVTVGATRYSSGISDTDHESSSSSSSPTTRSDSSVRANNRAVSSASPTKKATTTAAIDLRELSRILFPHNRVLDIDFSDSTAAALFPASFSSPSFAKAVAANYKHARSRLYHPFFSLLLALYIVLAGALIVYWENVLFSGFDGKPCLSRQVFLLGYVLSVVIYTLVFVTRSKPFGMGVLTFIFLWADVTTLNANPLIDSTAHAATILLALINIGLMISTFSYSRHRKPLPPFKPATPELKSTHSALARPVSPSDSHRQAKKTVVKIVPSMGASKATEGEERASAGKRAPGGQHHQHHQQQHQQHATAQLKKRPIGLAQTISLSLSSMSHRLSTHPPSALRSSSSSSSNTGGKGQHPLPKGSTAPTESWRKLWWRVVPTQQGPNVLWLCETAALVLISLFHAGVKWAVSVEAVKIIISVVTLVTAQQRTELQSPTEQIDNITPGEQMDLPWRIVFFVALSLSSEALDYVTGIDINSKSDRKWIRLLYDHALIAIIVVNFFLSNLMLLSFALAHFMFVSALVYVGLLSHSDVPSGLPKLSSLVGSLQIDRERAMKGGFAALHHMFFGSVLLTMVTLPAGAVSMQLMFVLREYGQCVEEGVEPFLAKVVRRREKRAGIRVPGQWNVGPSMFAAGSANGGEIGGGGPASTVPVPMKLVLIDSFDTVEELEKYGSSPAASGTE